MTLHEVKTEAQLQPLLASGKLVVIDFSASWCGPCRMIGPKFHSMADEAAFSNVVFVKIDVDESPDLAEKYGVEAMPTFVYLKNGKEVDRLLGASEPSLRQKLNAHK